MDAIKIAEILRTLRPDRGNAYAPASVRSKGAAAFKQWQETCRTFAYAVCVEAHETTEAEFYGACGYSADEARP